MKFSFSCKEATFGFFKRKTKYFLFFGIKLTAEECQWIAEKMRGDQPMHAIEYDGRFVLERLCCKDLILLSDSSKDYCFELRDLLTRTALENDIKGNLACMKEEFDKWHAFETSEDINDRRIRAFRRSNEAVKELYGSMVLADAIGSVIRRNNLTATQRALIVDTVGDIILSFDQKSELTELLIKKVGVSKAVAEDATRLLFPHLLII